MQFDHRKEFLKLTFGAIAFRQSEIQNSKDTFGVFKFFQCHVVRVSSIACYLTQAPVGQTCIQAPVSRESWSLNLGRMRVCLWKKNVVKF